ncbi:MAG TPA: DUF58 domain-containing protein [Myxococcota bacterium]|nr:DUF58 domain-containing protein [Myxococcota bacterium]
MAGARDRRAGPRPALAPASGRGLRGRLRRALRPPRTLRPTRAGWIFFGLTFGVGFAALNTGNNLLYLVLSLMLAFLVLSGVLSESALRGVEVRRRLSRELFAETPNRVALEVLNTKRRVPAFALVIEDFARAGGSGSRALPVGRAFVLHVPGGARAARFYALAPERRGPLHFTGFRISTRFPFGLFSKALELEQPESALVYPRVDPRPLAPVPHGAEDGGGGAARRAPAGAASGLREHRTGDPQRRIHWPATLRRGALLVRDGEDERRSEHEVRLRTAAAEPGEAFEQAVRWAASDVVALLAAGARVALRTDGTRLPPADGPAQRARLLAFLARVAPDASDPCDSATDRTRRGAAA